MVLAELRLATLHHLQLELLGFLPSALSSVYRPQHLCAIDGFFVFFT